MGSFNTLLFKSMLPDGIGLLGGNVYFMDPINGLDGNDGMTPETAVKTFEVGYALLTTNAHDTLVFMEGATASNPTAAIAWSKSYCYLVGASAPLGCGQRCRIVGTTAKDLTQIITVSGNGNRFYNIQWFNGGDADADAGAVLVTGSRNYFKNNMISGMGHATPAARAASYSLKISAGSENLFENCYIGLDTISRTAASAELVFASGATRNRFNNCHFATMAGSATTLFVAAAASAALDRWTKFQNCVFDNAVKSTATTMTEWGDIHSTVGGLIELDNCSIIGVTDWEAATVSGNVIITNAAPTAATSGLAVAVAAS